MAKKKVAKKKATRASKYWLIAKVKGYGRSTVFRPCGAERGYPTLSGAKSAAHRVLKTIGRNTIAVHVLELKTTYRKMCTVTEVK